MARAAKPSKRTVGRTRDAGWQIGVRRTLPITVPTAWKLITSRRGAALWLGDGARVRFIKGAAYRLPDGSAGKVTVCKPNSHLRLTWRPEDDVRGWVRPSTIQVRVIPSKGGTVIAFHQEHLPGPKERRQRKAHFTAALDALGQMAPA